MKKNNLLKVFGALAVAGALIATAACSKSDTNEVPVNLASGVAKTTNAAENNLSLEEAISAALAHAKVLRDNADFLRTELDKDDKVPHYEIEFYADGKEYDYEVAVNGGKILKNEVEVEKTSAKPEPSKPEVTKGGVDRNEPVTEGNGFISVDQAKAKALKDAGIKAADAVFEKAEFDGNDLIPHYDIEFYADGYEYDYEINAKNYNVIEKSKEKERAPKQPTQKNGFISADEAKQKALNHAGLKKDDARVKAELDADDIIPHYEVEIVAGRYEYDYEINAKTGAVIAHEKDYND